MASNTEPRFGISFGATTITASRFNSSDSLELMKFPASTEYQTYYQNAVHNFRVANHGTNIADFDSIITNTMRPITEALENQIGHVPEFSALILPAVLRRPAWNAASTVVFRDAAYIKKVSLTRDAACWAHGFLDDRNLGRMAEEYTERGPDSFVLVLEFQAEYMHAWLMDVAFELGTYSHDEETFCRECGENYRVELSANAYHERIQTFVTDFINNQVLKRHKREDVRAIVAAGDASGPAMAELSSIAVQAVRTEVVKVLADIEPSEVAAHGAAVLARMTQQEPELFVTYDGNRFQDEQYYAENEARRKKAGEHEEL